MKKNTKVRLLVFDILGNQVTELINNVYPAGRYQVEWDGTNSFGVKAGTGIYYYKIQAGEYTAIKKAVLIK